MVALNVGDAISVVALGRLTVDINQPFRINGTLTLHLTTCTMTILFTSIYINMTLTALRTAASLFIRAI